MAIREQTARGEFGFVQELWEAWQRKAQQKGNNVAAAFKRVEAEDDEDSDDDEEDEDEEDEDVDMGEAPALVRAPRERVEPEVDEDGFTKVVGKKRR
jgi:pre-rRNA-processing protein TSR2